MVKYQGVEIEWDDPPSDYEEAVQTADREAEECWKEFQGIVEDRRQTSAHSALTEEACLSDRADLFKIAYKAGYLSASGETVEI